MQVSTDTAVKFVSCIEGTTREGESYYKATFTDGRDCLQFYVTPVIYGMVNKMKIGDPCGVVFEMYQSAKGGTGARVKDVILGS